MNLLICLDDRDGLLFNKRRQSQDRVVREAMVRLSGGRLWMNEYSAGQFPDRQGLTVREDFLAACPEDGFCFWEGSPALAENLQIQKVIVFRWNRVYPADLRCTLPLKAWKMTKAEEFPGFSHEKITMEVYKP